MVRVGQSGAPSGLAAVPTGIKLFESRSTASLRGQVRWLRSEERARTSRLVNKPALGAVRGAWRASRWRRAGRGRRTSRACAGTHCVARRERNARWAQVFTIRSSAQPALQPRANRMGVPCCWKGTQRKGGGFHREYLCARLPIHRPIHRRWLDN